MPFDFDSEEELVDIIKMYMDDIEVEDVINGLMRVIYSLRKRQGSLEHGKAMVIIYSGNL